MIALIDEEEFMPLHRLLFNKSSSSVDTILMMIEKYPTALRHLVCHKYLAIQIECGIQCRLPVISKCIELYPESLAQVGYKGHLPLHLLLANEASTIAAALMVIDKYPAALLHLGIYGLPLDIECSHLCRSAIISRCIELYPELFPWLTEREECYCIGY
jgi:hypothetical protein